MKPFALISKLCKLVGLGATPPDTPPALPAEFAVLPQQHRWNTRAILTPWTHLQIAQAPWKDAEDLPGYKKWKALADERGRSDADLQNNIVRGLVNEIITAAAGVEREIRALRAATEVAQAWADEHITGPIPAVVTIGHPAAHHAALIVMNALNWTRAVGERVDRMDFKEPAGLLPSLKDSALKTAIEALFKTLDDPTLQNARRFDNYVLHYGAIQGGTTPGYHLRADRSVYFAFPDAVTKGVGTWEVFEYNDERDALTHLEEVFDGIATFIDGMLDAFDAQPRPPGWPH